MKDQVTKVNFNYVEYLLNIKLLSSGKRCLIIILPEFNIKKIYQKNNFIKNSNEIRYETILKPIIDLIDDFNPSVLTFNNRIDAKEYFDLPNQQKFPQNSKYEDINYSPFYVKNLYHSIKSSKSRPIIKANEQYLELLNFYQSKKNYKKLISISLRDSKIDEKNYSEMDNFRNSNLKVWLDVADWIKDSLNYTPIIIPDITQINLQSSDFRGHEILKLASLNLKMRVALYQKSLLNLTISAGFSELLYHSEFSFLCFKFGDNRIKQGANSININEDTYGIKKNEQLPYLNKKQKIYWGENTEEFGFIKNKVELFLDNQI